MLPDVFAPPVDWVPADLPDVDPEAVAVDVVEPLELVAVVAVELDGVAFEEAGFGVVPEEEHPAIVSSAMASESTAAGFERIMHLPVFVESQPPRGQAPGARTIETMSALPDTAPELAVRAP